MKTQITIEERIESYWTKRSKEFSVTRIRELKNDISERYLSVILEYLPRNKPLRILDVGTGAGFFAILLTRLGHTVTGIDLTPAMIEEAKSLSSSLQLDIDFKVMNAQELDFPTGTFDLVITRNLTWTLPDATTAYKEWYRVLKEGGTLLNFDAEYGKIIYATEDQAKTIHADLSMELLKECDDIKSGLSITSVKRPDWDVAILNQLGYNSVGCDKAISKRLHTEESNLHNPAPLFLIHARK